MSNKRLRMIGYSGIVLFAIAVFAAQGWIVGMATLGTLMVLVAVVEAAIRQ